MKYKRLSIWVIFSGAVIVGLLGLGGGCTAAGFKMAGGVLDNRADIFNRWYPAVKWCTNGLPFLGRLKEILDGKYIVLLQNNTELRPTGGFMGSYARLNFSQGVMTDYAVADIYQPDGQLPGHVEPPYPVQESFKQGWWKLRDSNWDPDFATAAATIKWFMEQGGEGNIKGIAAVNLELLKKWLSILGGVKVITYGETVTDKNLYSLAQSYAETRTDGDKTEKRNFLGAVGAAVMEKTRGAGVIKLARLAGMLVNELNNRQMMLWSSDGKAQADIERMRWDGELASGWDKSGDYLYVVDTNLGANKADCCIDRGVTQDVEASVSGATDQVITVTRKNNNLPAQVKPPVSWGSDYNDYVRVVAAKTGVDISNVTVNGRILRRATAEDFSIPNSQRQSESADMYNVEDKGDWQIIGFWMYVKAGEAGEAQIHLASRRNKQGEFKEWLVRQPGTNSLAYNLTVNGKIIKNGMIEKQQYIVTNY